MGFLSNLFKDTKRTGGAVSTAPKVAPYFPNVYNQDTNKSVMNSEHRYDLKRFSKHEVDVIYQVLRVVSQKYPENLQSMGLANETFPITYKARYVLFDIIIVRYEKSESPIDKLAVALAYESKGAFFRKQAISYYEEAIKTLDKSVLGLFSSYSTMAIYIKLADAYEKEHDYKKALSLLKKARASKGASRQYLTDRITAVEKKIESPPRTRKSKKPDYLDDFENDIRHASIAFLTGNFSGIEINARPNHSIYR